MLSCQIRRDPTADRQFYLNVGRRGLRGLSRIMRRISKYSAYICVERRFMTWLMKRRFMMGRMLASFNAIDGFRGLRESDYRTNFEPISVLCEFIIISSRPMRSFPSFAAVYTSYWRWAEGK